MVEESLTFECFILCYQIKINCKTKGIGWLEEEKKKKKNLSQPKTDKPDFSSDYLLRSPQGKHKI